MAVSMNLNSVAQAWRGGSLSWSQARFEYDRITEYHFQRLPRNNRDNSRLDDVILNSYNYLSRRLGGGVSALSEDEFTVEYEIMCNLDGAARYAEECAGLSFRIRWTHKEVKTRFYDGISRSVVLSADLAAMVNARKVSNLTKLAEGTGLSFVEVRDTHAAKSSIILDVLRAGSSGQNKLTRLVKGCLLYLDHLEYGRKKHAFQTIPSRPYNFASYELAMKESNVAYVYTDQDGGYASNYVLFAMCQEYPHPVMGGVEHVRIPADAKNVIMIGLPIMPPAKEITLNDKVIWGALLHYCDMFQLGRDLERAMLIACSLRENRYLSEIALPQVRSGVDAIYPAIASQIEGVWDKTMVNLKAAKLVGRTHQMMMLCLVKDLVVAAHNSSMLTDTTLERSIKGMIGRDAHVLLDYIEEKNVADMLKLTDQMKWLEIMDTDSLRSVRNTSVFEGLWLIDEPKNVLKDGIFKCMKKGYKMAINFTQPGINVDTFRTLQHEIKLAGRKKELNIPDGGYNVRLAVIRNREEKVKNISFAKKGKVPTTFYSGVGPMYRTTSPGRLECGDYTRYTEKGTFGFDSSDDEEEGAYEEDDEWEVRKERPSPDVLGREYPREKEKIVDTRVVLESIPEVMPSEEAGSGDSEEAVPVVIVNEPVSVGDVTSWAESSSKKKDDSGGKLKVVEVESSGVGRKIPGMISEEKRLELGISAASLVQKMYTCSEGRWYIRGEGELASSEAVEKMLAEIGIEKNSGDKDVDEPTLQFGSVRIDERWGDVLESGVATDVVQQVESQKGEVVLEAEQEGILGREQEVREKEVEREEICEIVKEQSNSMPVMTDKGLKDLAAEKRWSREKMSTWSVYKRGVMTGSQYDVVKRKSVDREVPEEKVKEAEESIDAKNEPEDVTHLGLEDHMQLPIKELMHGNKVFDPVTAHFRRILSTLPQETWDVGVVGDYTTDSAKIEHLYMNVRWFYSYEAVNASRYPNSLREIVETVQGILKYYDEANICPKPMESDIAAEKEEIKKRIMMDPEGFRPKTDNEKKLTVSSLVGVNVYLVRNSWWRTLVTEYFRTEKVRMVSTREFLFFARYADGLGELSAFNKLWKFIGNDELLASMPWCSLGEQVEKIVNLAGKMKGCRSKYKPGPEMVRRFLKSTSIDIGSSGSYTVEEINLAVRVAARMAIGKRKKLLSQLAITEECLLPKVVYAVAFLSCEWDDSDAMCCIGALRGVLDIFDR